MDISSYSSPFNLSHKAVEGLFDGTVVVQEKIDGSQISFRRNKDGVQVQSRRQPLDLGNPEGMFAKGVTTIHFLTPHLKEGWTYRGEYLKEPKHNLMPYKRVPKGHIMLYDVDTGDQSYLSPLELVAEADRLGLESVPLVEILTEKPSPERLAELLKLQSILGGPIEGLVFKNYAQYGPDKKVLMAKLVRDEFRETKQAAKPRSDLYQMIQERYATPARWRKAIQHLKEEGKIKGEMPDIPIIMREIIADTLGEEGESITQLLWNHYRKEIHSALLRGFPEFYKEELGS